MHHTTDSKSEAINTSHLELLEQLIGAPYLDFMTPGILAQSVLFIAIFFGIAVIWERNLGTLHKLLASPAPRSALVLGKALSSSERGLAQAAIVYLLAFALGVKLNLDPIAVVGVVFVVILGSELA